MNVSIKEIEEFENHPVWKEMLTTWEDRQRVHTGELTREYDIQKVHFLQGQINELEFSMRQPVLMLEEIMEEQDTKTETTEQGGEQNA